MVEVTVGIERGHTQAFFATRIGGEAMEADEWSCRECTYASPHLHGTLQALDVPRESNFSIQGHTSVPPSARAKKTGK